MPLTPSDTTYLNKLLDRHLKNQQSWPWARWLQLASGVLAILAGIWAWSLAETFNTFTLNFDLPATTRQSTAPSATQPITQSQTIGLLETYNRTAYAYARFAATMNSLSLCMTLGGCFLMLFGAHWVFQTLSRWNHHRRDKILITLLREKCAPELAMPPST